MLSQAQIQRAWAPPCRGPWITKSLHGGGQVQVRPAIWEAVDALNKVLQTFNYRARANSTGAYNCRQKVSGRAISMHAYGTALDINWNTNGYGTHPKTDMPRAMPATIVKIRTKNGAQVWNWGGYWSGNKDTMHYEIVCTPRDLASGINWATVPGGGGGTPPPYIPPTPNNPEPTPTPPAPQPTEEEDEMKLVRHTDGSIWLYSGLFRQHVSTPDEVGMFRFVGVTYQDVSGNPAFSDALLRNTVDVQNVNVAAWWSKVAAEK